MSNLPVPLVPYPGLRSLWQRLIDAGDVGSGQDQIPGQHQASVTWVVMACPSGSSRSRCQVRSDDRRA